MTPATDIAFSHYTPGRLRLKSASLRRDGGVAERIRTTLGAVPGIHKVTTNALTGSMLIEFSPSELATPAASARLLQALAALFPQNFGSDWLSADVDALIGRETLGRRIAAALSAAPGIATATCEKGTVSIRFDPATLSIPSVLERLGA
jgi:hypothetical protein